MNGGETKPLRRDIGFLGSAFLSFNGIVGAGIFALPAMLHTQFGSFSPWLFPIFGLMVLLIALPFARLASIHPQSGGPVAYTRTFGPIVSFQAGWLYYLARSAALGANANVFATYAAALWPPLDSVAGRAATILLLVGSLNWINVIGVRRAIRALDALTLLKATPLVVFAIWGLIEVGGAVPAPGPLPEFGAFEAAALVILYAFIGFENSTVPAEETENARRTIPRALIGTVAATAALYFLIQLAYVAVMPAGAAPEAPLAAFAETLVGPIGALILTATILASVGGNMSSAITATPRVTFALAEQGSMPAWFGRISARYGTPANSVLFMGVVVAALALSGSFVWLAVLSTLARLAVYSFSIASLPRTDRPTAATWAITAPGLIVCLWAATQSGWQSWAGLWVAIVAGLVLYALARRQAGSSSAGTVSSIQPPPSTRSSY